MSRTPAIPRDVIRDHLKRSIRFNYRHDEFFVMGPTRLGGSKAQLSNTSSVEPIITQLTLVVEELLEENLK